MNVDKNHLAPNTCFVIIIHNNNYYLLLLSEGPDKKYGSKLK